MGVLDIHEQAISFLSSAPGLTLGWFSCLNTTIKQQHAERMCTLDSGVITINLCEQTFKSCPLYLHMGNVIGLRRATFYNAAY
ncbi:hypothetical protein XENOCAPTIV_016294 [Xenoophorus captivus]|uniref:Uncharacterized protein n=1 Tax=Xenoophorus captivus TaxID=1517983 RepID=A0ABV0RAP4_9TELE